MVEGRLSTGCALCSVFAALGEACGFCGKPLTLPKFVSVEELKSWLATPHSAHVGHEYEGHPAGCCLTALQDGKNSCAICGEPEIIRPVRK